jgi:hypothetical protein
MIDESEIGGKKQTACQNWQAIHALRILVRRRRGRFHPIARKNHVLNFVSLRSKPLMILSALSESMLLLRKARRASRLALNAHR